MAQFAAAPTAHPGSTPSHVGVGCGERRGTLIVAQGRIILESGQSVSPTEFEKLGGRAATKKWKQSIRVLAPDGSPAEPIGEWLAARGIDIRGNCLAFVMTTVSSDGPHAQLPVDHNTAAALNGSTLFMPHSRNSASLGAHPSSAHTAPLPTLGSLSSYTSTMAISAGLPTVQRHSIDQAALASQSASLAHVSSSAGRASLQLPTSSGSLPPHTQSVQAQQLLLSQHQSSGLVGCLATSVETQLHHRQLRLAQQWGQQSASSLFEAAAAMEDARLQSLQSGYPSTGRPSSESSMSICNPAAQQQQQQHIVHAATPAAEPVPVQRAPAVDVHATYHSEPLPRMQMHCGMAGKLAAPPAGYPAAQSGVMLSEMMLKFETASRRTSPPCLTMDGLTGMSPAAAQRPAINPHIFDAIDDEMIHVLNEELCTQITHTQQQQMQPSSGPAQVAAWPASGMFAFKSEPTNVQPAVPSRPPAPAGQPARASAHARAQQAATAFGLGMMTHMAMGQVGMACSEGRSGSSGGAHCAPAGNFPSSMLLQAVRGAADIDSRPNSSNCIVGEQQAESVARSSGSNVTGKRPASPSPDRGVGNEEEWDMPLAKRTSVTMLDTPVQRMHQQAVHQLYM